ncbi:hypothetical protein M513_05733 [Trichuris suis]|uniref:eIF3a PCI domain-containing protein n=2 Tax=Trichuris suis TaxID=68888 RepID=A0A085M8C3_9BILA|nr:hypothetical protein M513_05733 [Trichuris suis]
MNDMAASAIMNWMLICSSDYPYVNNFMVLRYTFEFGFSAFQCYRTAYPNINIKGSTRSSKSRPMSSVVSASALSDLFDRMSSQQDPENALRLANDLVDLGEKENALAALHKFINFSKNRVWSECFKQTMHKYMELCVELRMPHVAKDGLRHYRRMCLQKSVESLEEVLVTFLQLGEMKTAIATTQSQGTNEEVAEDLDKVETSKMPLLSAVTNEGAQERADKSILTPWLCFLWESYKECLELLRNNVHLELLYHRVARLAFLFCLRYQRKTEFRKLSERMRNHFTQLKKDQQRHFNVDLSNPQTITLYLETTILQLDVAIQLESWQEAIKRTEDIHKLFIVSGRLPEGPILAAYYEMLELLFWKTKQSLYHATALLKLFQLCKEDRKDWLEKMPNEATHLATRILLAIMSIPAVEAPGILTRHLDLEDSKAGHQRRLESHLRLTGPPSRRTLCKEMADMGVNLCALPAAQSLYSLFENNSNPLTLAADIQPHLASIQETCKSEYTQYIEPLKEVLAIKILKQLSQVYKSLSMKKLYTLIPFFDANKLENDIAYAGWKNVVKVRINYVKQSLDFGGEEAFTLPADAEPSAESLMLDVAALRQTPSDQINRYIQKMHDCLKEAVQATCSLANAELRSVIADLHKLQRHHAFEDHEAILQRRRGIETYKEETEKMQLEMVHTSDCIHKCCPWFEFKLYRDLLIKMSRYQKPENALRYRKRFFLFFEDLLNVGKKQHALAALQDFINFSKNRVWSKCFEQIMHKYMELCVDLRRPHVAKDGLFQYRRMCQQINVKSLEEVVLAFLELGEKKAAIAKAESQGVAEEIAEDLDQAESPERLLLSAVSGEGAQDRADRSILSPWLRFLWESYRQCLELLRNNVQVELLYHRVARLAFLFCLRYQRKAEFRKLSENLRTHLTQLQKHQQSHFNVKLSNPETIALHQETRILQLDVAIQLESWQEAIKSTDDVQQLFAISGRLPKGPNLASYYEKLALIFWKAKDSLYHASALLKLFQLCKENRKNWLEKMSDEATHLATRVLLAIISIRAVESPAILSRHLDLEDSKADHQRRLASLLRLTGPPSRRTLCKEMARMGVNVCALPAAQSLYNIFESNNNPLTLAADVRPHLESIQETGKSEYTQYVEPLQEVLTIKILKQVLLLCVSNVKLHPVLFQLSQVYKSLSMKKLYTLIPFFDANKLENDIAYAGWKNVVQVRINYLKQSLDFGVEEAFTLATDADPSAESSMLDVAALRHTPCDQIHGYIQKMHNCLKEAVQATCSVADSELRSVIADLHKLQRYHAFDDHEAILERRRRIETYKEETEKMQLKMEETVRERERYEAEAQRLAEQSRLEQENTERQQAIRRREQEELQKRVVRDRLERMKDPKFRRFLAEMPEEEIENLDNDTLLQKQITHMEQEKREHMAKLRVAEKKWDHMVRALRIEEMPRLVDNYEKEAEMAPTFWMEHEKERVATAIEDRKLYLATHERLKRMQEDANQFKESLKEKTVARFEEKMKQWEQKMQEFRKARLEDRKAKRKEIRRRLWLEEKAEAERQKLDEERKKKEEEERSMKQAKYGGYGLRGMDMEKRGAGKDREPEFVGTWERKGPIETKQEEPFNETWVKGRRQQADLGPQRTLFDASRGSYRMSSMRSSELDSDASWQSRRTVDGLADRPRGRMDDLGSRPFAFDRARNRLAEPEPDLDFSRARMTQRVAEQNDRPQRPGLRPGGTPYGSQDARLQPDPYRRINVRDRAGPDDDVTFSRSSFGRKLESDKGGSLSPERSAGGGGGPTEARRERSFGQQQQTNAAGVYRPPIGGNRYGNDNRPSFMTRTDQSNRVGGDSWRSGSRGVEEKSSLAWRRQGQADPQKTTVRAEEREGAPKSTREKPNVADNDLDEGWSRKSESDTMQWLVFCVHSDKIPLLEAYLHPKEVMMHSPFRVVDLLDCAYVIRTVADDCKLSIGFEHEDRLPIQMATVSLQEREDWVQALTEKLCSMGCMNVPSNLYSAYPRSGSVGKDQRLGASVIGSQQISINSATEACPSAECTSYEALRPSDAPDNMDLEQYLVPESTVESRRSNSRTSDISEQSTEQIADTFSYDVSRSMEKPPLPPRDSTISHSSNILVFPKSAVSEHFIVPYDSSAYDVPTSSGHSASLLSAMGRKEPSSQPSVEVSDESGGGSTFALASCAEVASRLSDEASRKSSTSSGQSSQASISSFYKSLPKEKQRVQGLCPSSLMQQCASHSCVDVATSQPISAGEQACSPPVPAEPPPALPPKKLLSMLRVSLREQEVLRLKTEVQSHHGLKITLSIAEILHIAFVDVAGFLWICGWQTSDVSGKLRSFVHIGDRLIAVDGLPVDSDAQLRSFISNRFALDRKCEVVLKRMPMAKVFLFKRSHDGECVGLTMRKGKNEVEGVREGSLAWRAGFRVKTISSINPDMETTWYITEVNNRPVSVFSKNGECKQRLTAIGRELSIVVQPTDFVKLLKRQMKCMKRYRDFIVS